MKRSKRIIASILAFVLMVSYIPMNFGGFIKAKAMGGTTEVSTLGELQTALADDTDSEIVVKNIIPLTDGTVLVGNHKTVRASITGTNEQGVSQEGSEYSVFSIPSGASVSIQNLTVKGGSYTAIMNEGTITMNQVSICQSGGRAQSTWETGKYGGGMVNTGNAKLMKCSFTRNVANFGGGFVNIGTMYLEQCSVTENRNIYEGASGGGGLENQGTLYLNNCTVANNQSTEIGGGINNCRGDLYVMNSTITGNVSNAGNYSAQNGGGIGCNSGSVNVVNSIITNNYAKGNNAFVLSDMGDYSSWDVNIYHSVVGTYVVGSSGTTDVPCGDNVNNLLNKGSETDLFAGYRNSYLLNADGTENVSISSFARPVITELENHTYGAFLKKNDSYATTKGCDTYLGMSGDMVSAIAYGSDQTYLLGTNQEISKVTTYQNGENRGKTIGALGDTESSYCTVIAKDIEHGVLEGANAFGETYKKGENVTITAKPEKNYGFIKWQEYKNGVWTDIENATSTTYTIESISKDHVIRAIFENIYRIDQQPSKENGFTIGTHEVTGTNVTYQWYKTSAASLTDEENGEHYYFEKQENGDYVSNNTGKDGSQAITSFTFDADEGDIVSFDYTVSSEQNYDIFSVELDETLLATIGNASGSVSNSYVGEALTEGTHTIVFQYKKDGSCGDGEDKVVISNLQVGKTIKLVGNTSPQLNVAEGITDYASYKDNVLCEVNYKKDDAVLSMLKSEVVKYEFISVKVTKDDEGYTGRSVSLWQNDAKKYTLKEYSDGIYGLCNISGGDYAIYVDGENAKKKLSVGGNFEQTTVAYYTVTYKNTDSDTALYSPVTYLAGTMVTENPEITREGYTFEGWYKDVTLTDRNMFPFTVEKPTTLYANWTGLNKFTVNTTLDGTAASGETIDSKFQGYYLKEENATDYIPLVETGVGTYQTKVPVGKYDTFVKRLEGDHVSYTAIKDRKFVEVDYSTSISYYTVSIAEDSRKYFYNPDSFKCTMQENFSRVLSLDYAIQFGYDMNSMEVKANQSILSRTNDTNYCYTIPSVSEPTQISISSIELAKTTVKYYDGDHYIVEGDIPTMYSCESYVEEYDSLDNERKPSDIRKTIGDVEYYAEWHLESDLTDFCTTIIPIENKNSTIKLYAKWIKCQATVIGSNSSIVKHFPLLNNAIVAARADKGSTLRLTEDVQAGGLRKMVEAQEEAYTFDLNGHILTVDNLLFSIWCGKVTIVDKLGEGEIISNRKICPCNVQNGGTLVLESGSIISNMDDYGVYVMSEDATLIVNGGTISSNGNSGVANQGILKVNGGTIKNNAAFNRTNIAANMPAIYNVMHSKIYISGTPTLSDPFDAIDGTGMVQGIDSHNGVIVALEKNSIYGNNGETGEELKYYEGEKPIAVNAQWQHQIVEDCFVSEMIASKFVAIDATLNKCGIEINQRGKDNKICDLMLVPNNSEFAVQYYEQGDSDEIKYTGTAITKENRKYTFGAGLTLPTEVTKVGYNFEGWYDNYEGGNKVTTISNKVAGKQTVYAKWTPKGELTADDFTKPTDQTYTGESQSQTITKEDGVTGVGDITHIYYEGVNGTAYEKSETAPTDAGEYRVIVDVAEGNDYAAASDIVIDTYTIAKKTLTATYEGETIYLNGTPDGTVKVSGFIDSENADNAAGYSAPSVSFARIDKSVEGTHSLTPAGGVAKNYEFTYVAGNLVITKEIIASTVTIKKDESAYSGVTVKLYQNGIESYELTEDANTGEYKGTVAVGSYDVYVGTSDGGNGAVGTCDTGVDFTVSQSMHETTLNYYTVTYHANVPSGHTSTGSVPTDNTAYLSGAEVSVASPVNSGNLSVAGYKLKGFATTPTAENAETSFAITVSQKNWYAIWEAKAPASLSGDQDIFDQNAESDQYDNIKLELNLGDDTLDKVMCDSVELVENEQYQCKDGEYEFYRSYLKTLTTGTHTIKFHLGSGDILEKVITVKNTTVPKPTPEDPATTTEKPATTTEKPVPTSEDLESNQVENEDDEATVNYGKHTFVVKVVNKKLGQNVLTWKKVENADGYFIYASRCSNKKNTYRLKKIATVEKGKKLTYKDNNLLTDVSYKYRIKAYRIIKGKKVIIASTITSHSFNAVSSFKYQNPIKIKTSKKSITLKKGKKFKLVTKVTSKGNEKLGKHCARVRYIIDNKKIVTVSKKGVIKAKKKGTAIIYVVSTNGYSKKVKVKVK